MNDIKNKIKLVIWDLDETFWRGTLSEEGIIYNYTNHAIVIELAKRGIVSSICSKNTFNEVQKIFVESGLWPYFVFPEIQWSPKGELVRKIISDMGLRAENVLFIDDNIGNLKEVEFSNEGISICEPSIIPHLLVSSHLKGKDDTDLTRLSQYRVLEEKRQVLISSGKSNAEFLMASDIQVSITKNSLDELDRISELIERTNQLNYTKNRPSHAELIEQLSDPKAEFGYVSVSDKFGAYGISGFYLVKNKKLLHFLFSCRIMNMGIESWLFKHIGRPALTVTGSVAMDLNIEDDHSYIRLVKDTDNKELTSKGLTEKKLILIGGCDLDQVVHYLSYPNIITDFNYINGNGLSVHSDHTELLRQFSYEHSEYDHIIDQIPILDKSDRSYKLFNLSWDVLIMSPLNDFSRGLYRHNESGFILPFDGFNINWTDPENWDHLPKHLYNIPRKFLSALQAEYTFLGPISPVRFRENIEFIRQSFPDKKIVFLTGSEVDLNPVDYWERDMHHRHIQMNTVLRELAQAGEIEVIDVNEYISGAQSHTNNIRHYDKKVYYEIANTVTELINAEAGTISKVRNNFYVNLRLSAFKYIHGVKKLFRTW
jgi:FkbH-like protein